MFRLMTLCMFLFPLMVSTAHADDQYQFRGKMMGPEGTLRGQVTITTKAIEVEKKFLWVRDSIAYDFKGTKSVRIRRGLLRTRIRVREANDGSFVQVRTWSWHYGPLQNLLSEKL